MVSNDSCKDKAVKIAFDNIAIQRIEEQCINCGRCKTICEDFVSVKYDHMKAKEAVCINCGQCILNCPVGALIPKYDYKRVLNYLHDTEKIVTISIAPAVRTSIGEGFNQDPGTFLEKELVGALKMAGFDYVFDVTFGADLTIMEEATELIRRKESKENLPMFTSCCPSWVKYLEIYHPSLLNHLSTTKSPIACQSAIINTYFSKMQNIAKSAIINVVVVPCTAKKFEIKRTEMGMDIALTTSELVLLLKESNIDISKVKPKEFDSILAKGSGAGLIFGSSGGVLEAVLRCANYFLTGEEKEELFDFEAIRGDNKVKKATVNLGKYSLKVAAVSGMPNIEEILKELTDYDFIEIMNCPNGCVGGGGQVLGAINKQREINMKRSLALYLDDNKNKIKASYANPDIISIYKTYLKEPGSDKALKILHTSFKDRSSILGE